jgi:hypothetical protein
MNLALTSTWSPTGTAEKTCNEGGQDLNAASPDFFARADQQHAWVMAGDDRGVYGDYPPAGNL